MAVAVAASTAASCPPVGDSVMRVRGQVLHVGDGHDCQLSLYTANDNRLRARRTIGVRFESSFTIPARKREYYFVVTCAGVAGQFTSQRITAGPHSLVDLGQVELQP